MSEVELLKRDISSVIAVTVHKAPWLSIILRKLDIDATWDANFPVAGVSESGVLVVNVKRWPRLPASDKQFILLHEALHIALEHFLRCRRIKGNPLLYNIAADCVINHLLDQQGLQVPGDAVTPEKLSMLVGEPSAEIKRMSAEEIYYLLVNSGVSPQVMPDLPVEGQEGQEPGKREPVQIGIFRQGGEGKVNVGEDSSDEKEIEEKVRSLVREAVVMGRVIGEARAGRGRSDLERALNAVLAPRVAWERELRMAVREGLGPFVISSWKRVNRRCPALYPGYKRLAYPKVWVVVDVSGSIDSDLLDQFVSELSAISKICKVHGIFFSDGIVHECKVSPFTFNATVRGGGGTVIAPALKRVLSDCEHRDIVVILTDGRVADEEDEKQLLEQLVRRVNRIIYCSTAKFPDVRGIRMISIER